MDGALDGVLGEETTDGEGRECIPAVDLHGGEAEVVGDIGVLDGQGLVELLALDPLGGDGTTP